MPSTPAKDQGLLREEQRILPHKGTARLLALLMAAAGGLAGQDGPETTKEFWPEANLYWKLSGDARLLLTGALTKNRDGEDRETEFGTYVDLFVRRFRPILFRRSSHLDDSRIRRITFRAGYRYQHTISKDPPVTEHRAQSDATLRWGLPLALLMSNRHRGEYRFIESKFSFRYRNEIKVERDVTLWGIPVNPYVSGEIFYDSRYNAFSRWRYTGGAVISLGQHFTVEPYFMRQIAKHPRFQPTNAIGVTLNLYGP